MGRGDGITRGAVVAPRRRNETPAATTQAPAATKPAAKPRRKSWKQMSAQERDQVTAAKREKTEKALENLEKMVEAMTPEAYGALLEKMVKGGLWRYSASNLCLIQMQLDNPTRVASYKAWEKQNRQVKKGEKGAAILRPLTRTVPMLDGNGNPVLDDKGKPKKRQQIIRGQFGLGSVFDISQTSPMPGKEVVEDKKTKQSAEQCAEDMTRIAEQRGIKVFRGGVEDEDFPYRHQLNGELLRSPNAGGYYLQAKIPKENEEPEELQVIVTRKGLSAQEEARVLSHELGHAMLHRGERDLDPHVMEVEAESVGFALCSDYGVETEHSAAYLLNWAKSKKEPNKELRASMERVRRAVKEVMEARDGEETS